jgi:hypothetical protein
MFVLKVYYLNFEKFVDLKDRLFCRLHFRYQIETLLIFPDGEPEAKELPNEEYLHKFIFKK